MTWYTDLAERWRTEADRLEKLGVSGDALMRCLADELEQAGRDFNTRTLTVEEAANISGYSEEHIRELVRSGAIPDSRPSGSQGRILIRAADLPRKPGTHAAVDELAMQRAKGR